MDSARMIGTDTRRHYAFEARRGPFVAFAQESRLHLRSTIAYRAQDCYEALSGLFVTRDGLLVRAAASGRAAMTVRQR